MDLPNCSRVVQGQLQTVKTSGVDKPWQSYDECPDENVPVRDEHESSCYVPTKIHEQDGVGVPGSRIGAADLGLHVL